VRETASLHNKNDEIDFYQRAEHNRIEQSKTLMVDDPRKAGRVWENL